VDAAVETVLAEYHERERAEERLARSLPPGEMFARRDEFLISVGADTGRLLNVLARSIDAKRIVELGTSYGYSTVWLAEAARATGGTVVSMDIDPAKQAYASERLARAGLAQAVEFRCGDARETLASLDGPFDLILIDLWKDLYIACFDLCYAKLRPGSLIVADNMLQPVFNRADALAYRAHVRSRPHIESVLLPIGSGIELSRYAQDLND
jgi:predicted O-methyltransferase YrrM